MGLVLVGGAWIVAVGKSLDCQLYKWPGLRLWRCCGFECFLEVLVKWEPGGEDTRTPQTTKCIPSRGVAAVIHLELVELSALRLRLALDESDAGVVWGCCWRSPDVAGGPGDLCRVNRSHYHHRASNAVPGALAAVLT